MHSSYSIKGDFTQAIFREEAIFTYTSNLFSLRDRCNGGTTNEGLFHGERTCRTLPGEPKNDLQAVMGEGDSGL